MSYAKDGYPVELANKVGHIKLIQDPMIQKLIESFEDCSAPALDQSKASPTGNINLDEECQIKQVITVDGGHQAVPNVVRPERQVGFIQIAAQLLKMETIEFLNSNPMADPRDVRKILSEFTHHTLVALPLTGINSPGLTVKESLRDTIHRFISHYELYAALSYLVYREWLSELEESQRPSMNCLSCKEQFELPRHQLKFECPHCKANHTLSDYLGLVDQDAEDRGRVETVSNFRSVLEALALFSFIIRFRDNESIMKKTLFLLDGPLILRAQLARLVEPIRALIKDQKDRGLSLFIVGAEKGGGLVEFAKSWEQVLKKPGDYFLPNTKYILEEIQGRNYDERTYRNRVNYGAKVIVRIGINHVLALNVPTGEYLIESNENDLVGFKQILQALSKLVSYSYENALIPIVLVNGEASISNQPSGGILAQFVDKILQGDIQSSEVEL